MRAEGLTPGPPSGGVATELDGHSLNYAPGEPDGPVREKTRAEQLAEERTTVGRRIEQWTNDTRALDRARTAPDHSWTSLGDALGRGFDPGWDVLDKGPPQPGVHGQFWDSWKRAASNYGRTGKPTTDDERGSLNTELATARNEDRGLIAPSLTPPLGAIDLGGVTQVMTTSGWTRKLVATLKITQRDDGSIFTIELSGSSGNPFYDRLAMQQARRLDTLRLAPPKDGHASLWAFETTFTQIPPAPIAGCALDDFVPKRCFHPLQKLTRSHVTLQAIY
jgi:hypothetical protein